MLKLYPELLAGADLDANINSVCVQIAEKWVASLKSRSEGDSVSIGPPGFDSYLTRDKQTSSEVAVTLWVEQEEVCYLKPVVQSCSDQELALEAIRAVNAIAYKGLEIWTPLAIKEMFAHERWGGATTDKAFIEEFEVMNDEPIDPTDESILMPSKWDETLAKSGYVEVGDKPKMTLKALAETAKTGSPAEKALATAIRKLRAINKLGHVRHSDEESYNNVQPAFVFLWDNDDMLPHALDEILESKWNSGEGRDCQLSIAIDETSSQEKITTDILAFEGLVEIQQAVGAIFDAMLAITKTE